MNEQDVFAGVIEIVRPFVKNMEALDRVSMDTSIMKDLKVNSARLVDVVIDIEDRFGIEVSDEDADKVRTLGDAVRLVVARSSASCRASSIDGARPVAR
jgi:acyl carrier protein